ncbi:peptide deformylase 1B, chloroplastic/mitochondrial-like isoform X1 [Salvia splendens]|uniref:peptide deformylase 1B, chloroplastic/mitochondrial-like isoform X1 n=1 Tax=Salvia splendens TaxID=180675 RepID=UPI001C26EF2F|nr:peptide deformylase 1B, chloroplastic/mitochondrial-like isoform X1 [Salvia splendens]
MAAPTQLLHSNALNHTLLPFLRRHNPLFLRAASFASFSLRRKLPFRLIHAQARRISSAAVAKDELAASRELQEHEIEIPRKFLSMSTDLQFKGPLEVIKYPDPILRAKNKRIESFDESLKRLADEMFDVMYITDGIGLSAPQVGINVQLMVFNPAGERGEGEEIVLVNPQIKRFSKKIVPFEEGCLSFPKIYADVMRPDSLKVDAQDIKGARFQINLTGLLARVFQHEYDHLQGVLFFERMSDEVLDTVRAQLQELEKEYEEKTGLASPEKIGAREIRKKGVGFGKS